MLLLIVLLASVNGDDTTPFPLIAGAGFGSRAQIFNQVISDYFQRNFGQGGKIFLEQFKTVDSSAITDQNYLKKLNNEIDHVLSVYGYSKIGVIIQTVTKKSTNVPRARVHLLMGFLDVTRAPESQSRTLALLSAFDDDVHSIESKTQREIDTRDIYPKLKSIFELISAEFHPQISAIIIRLTTTLGYCPLVHECLMSSHYLSTGSSKNGLSKLGFLGVLDAAAKLCQPDRFGENKPLICEHEFGEEFLKQILETFWNNNYQCPIFTSKIIVMTQYLWISFHSDFVFNRVSTTTAGINTKQSFKGLLKIFSLIGNLKFEILREILGPFFPAKGLLGDVPNSKFLTPEESAALETQLTNQKNLLCKEAQEKNIVLEYCH